MNTFLTFQSQLDDLLFRICEKLELSPTQFKRAESRYEGVGQWLSNEQTLLGPAKPSIYPQGSARIGTTIKPPTQKEFDIDLVCELQLDPNLISPSGLVRVVHERIASHDTYKKLLVTGTNRCIRLTYADEFRLDIVPAVPYKNGDETSILIPDRQANKWIATNPKGFASWFELQAVRRIIRLAEERVEPLPPQQDGSDKSPLKKVVQLIKRNRDIHFDTAAKQCPKSIILTTLVGHAFEGNQSIGTTLESVLVSIVDRIDQTQGGRLVVLNPALTHEDLSECWESNTLAYQMFTNWVRVFLKNWRQVYAKRSIPEISALLGQLFGETVTIDVIREQTELITSARESNTLRSTGTLGSLGISQGIPVRRNTFFGD